MVVLGVVKSYNEFLLALHRFIDLGHNWESTQLWWFRNQFCSLDTDQSLCLVSDLVAQ